MGVVKVLIVDDYNLFRSGVAALIDQQADFDVVGEAQNGTQALEKALELKPDVILISTQLSDMSGLEVVRRIRKRLPDVKIVLFTDAEEKEDLWQMIQVGVQGLLSKQINPDGLCRTLQAVCRGEMAMSRYTITRLVSEVAYLARKGWKEVWVQEQPSRREREILTLLTTGASNKEIASSLNISEHTVKTHMKNIMAKFGLENRVQVATYALRFQNGRDRFFRA